MRIGIIDLGTNSVRFDVHQIGPGTRLQRLHREKLMVRLGQGVFSDGRLDKAAVRRTLQAFSSFQRTAEDLGADKVIAFGTSALREASDSEKFLNLIRTRTSIDVRVISGREEAKLIASGILANEKTARSGRVALVDIGGGSTEISICRGKEVLHSESFALGTARLQQIFLKSSPPKMPAKGELSPIEQLRRYIRNLVYAKKMSEDWPKSVQRVIGSSGTIRALAKIVRKNGGGKAIELKELKKLIKEMSTMTTTQLLGLPGMESKRVDMILAGAILLEECMEAIGVKKTFTTDYSLRDGILEEEIHLVHQHKASHIALHIPDLYVRAKRFGGSEVHLKQVVSLCDRLFDDLKRLHRLKPQWRTYLTAAAILHDLGESISPTRHEIHSYYIVKNADIPSMEKWEAEFVAQLCLLHKGGKVDAKALPFANDKIKTEAFLKLLALLRIADALDRGHKGTLKIKAVQVQAKKVNLIISGRSTVDLELLRVDQKKDLFERMFKKSLHVATG